MLRIFALAVLLPVSALAAKAQGVSPGRTVPIADSPFKPPTSDTTVQSLFIAGKVAIDDGTRLTDPAAIQSICEGHTHTEAYTDSKGNFSFEVRTPNQPLRTGTVNQASDSSGIMVGKSAIPPGAKGVDPLRSYVSECRIQAVLPGFTSPIIELSSKAIDSGSNDVGTLMLHRTAHIEGLTLSVTTAQAPPKARKQYDRGRELERKGEWDAALESFEKTVNEYPKFAIAWFELGRLQQQKGDWPAATQSFRQSVAADPKFVSPYHELAQMAASQRQWQEMVDATDQLLKLNPVNFPIDWWLNAVGYFNLKNYDAAEKSARHGLEADTQHQIPRLEYLLGMALAEKRDYAGALEHLRNYVRLAPHATDAAAVQRQADEIENLGAQTRAVK